MKPTRYQHGYRSKPRADKINVVVSQLNVWFDRAISMNVVPSIVNSLPSFKHVELPNSILSKAVSKFRSSHPCLKSDTMTATNILEL